MNNTESKPCEFIAAVMAVPDDPDYPIRENRPDGTPIILPFRVEGMFFLHEGLAVVMHKGYGRHKESPLVFISEYATGLFMVSGKRSEIMDKLAKEVERLRESQVPPTVESVKNMYRRFRGFAEPKNHALLPKDYYCAQ